MFIYDILMFYKFSCILDFKQYHQIVTIEAKLIITRIHYNRIHFLLVNPKKLHFSNKANR